jgi:predicted GIY-YIG superfamily endonuclease
MREDRTYSVYILGSISGTVYIGVTGNLRRRMWQHKNHVFAGLTAE